MEEVVRQYIKSMKLAAGLNTQRVFEAWDACSGVKQYTLRKFYRGGKLTVTLNSSMVRESLYFQKDLLVKKINDYLKDDPLFVSDNRNVGYVQELILR